MGQSHQNQHECVEPDRGSDQTEFQRSCLEQCLRNVWHFFHSFWVRITWKFLPQKWPHSWMPCKHLPYMDERHERVMQFVWKTIIFVDFATNHGSSIRRLYPVPGCMHGELVLNSEAGHKTEGVWLASNRHAVKWHGLVEGHSHPLPFAVLGWSPWPWSSPHHSRY